MKKYNRDPQKGAAMLAVTFIILIAMVAGVAFMMRTRNALSLSNAHSGSLEAQYQMESAYQLAKSKISRAMSGASLTGKLKYVNNSSTLVTSGERFDILNNLYATNTTTAMTFLEDMVESQAYSTAGSANSSNEFYSFATAFPTTWTDPTPNDSNYFQLKYTFTPLRVESQVASDPKQITFDYEYRVQMRGYGQSKFLSANAEDSGFIRIQVRGAPFSQWAVFANSLLNQNGATLWFAGGNTSAQAQEVYGGPVHINQKLNFYGHPAFLGRVTSAAAESTWSYASGTGYTGCPSMCPTFAQGKEGGVPTVTMPSAIFNTHRLAAGDTSSTAATNNNQPTNAEMLSFLRQYAGGTIPASATSVPQGIYIPVDNQSALQPTGGIYVEGNAKISLDVVSGSADFSTGQWAGIQEAHKSCKFQKIKVTGVMTGTPVRDIYIGDDPCTVTYVFDGSSASATPTIVNGRLNGNIHVNGSIDELGGASRTRPAVAQDFAMTVSGLKTVKIINDIQYEDAQYVTVDSAGNMGSTIVATPTGPYGGSGIQPTATNVAAQISSTSSTILGIMSTQGNILIHSSAPNDINLHGAMYAGNSSAYSSSTGLGCGTSGANTQGCGFGVENYATAPNKGNIKFLGGLSEYKDQTTGAISGTTTHGYSSRYFYDTRLLQDISPPAFPISNFPQAFGTVFSYKTWRISQNP